MSKNNGYNEADAKHGKIGEDYFFNLLKKIIKKDNGVLKNFHPTQYPNGIYEEDILLSDDKGKEIYFEVERRKNSWKPGKFPFDDINILHRRTKNKPNLDKTIFLTMSSDKSCGIICFPNSLKSERIEANPTKERGETSVYKVPKSECVEIILNQGLDKVTKIIYNVCNLPTTRNKNKMIKKTTKNFSTKDYISNYRSPFSEILNINEYQNFANSESTGLSGMWLLSEYAVVSCNYKNQTKLAGFADVIDDSFEVLKIKDGLKEYTLKEYGEAKRSFKKNPNKPFVHELKAHGSFCNLSGSEIGDEFISKKYNNIPFSNYRDKYYGLIRVQRTSTNSRVKNLPLVASELYNFAEKAILANLDFYGQIKFVYKNLENYLDFLEKNIDFLPESVFISFIKNLDLNPTKQELVLLNETKSETKSELEIKPKVENKTDYSSLEDVVNFMKDVRIAVDKYNFVDIEDTIKKVTIEDIVNKKIKIICSIKTVDL